MKPAPHRTSDPFLGVTVLEDYRVVAHLRTEPRGDTYRALPLHTGQAVLVKLIAQSLPRDNSARATWARLWGQAERMPRVDHPNVERVLDCGLVRVDGAERFCVVTEMLEGESLLAHVRTRGRFAVDEVLTVGQQIAQGLSATHRVGLVHGDLRATNVTLVGHASNDGADARVVLCDVGLTNLLVASLGGSPTLREMLCSPESIAPEQIRGEPTTPATDVYAFGVVLYRLLTGVAPFHADNTTQMLRAHLTRPVPPMRDRCQALEVPAVLEALVRKCLAKRQEDRPHTIDALLAGLQECEATVLSMSNAGTPSWIAPRPVHSLPTRALSRAEPERPPRPQFDSAPLSIDALPDDAPAALPATREILPTRAPSGADIPALPALVPALPAPITAPVLAVVEAPQASPTAPPTPPASQITAPPTAPPTPPPAMEVPVSTAPTPVARVSQPALAPPAPTPVPLATTAPAAPSVASPTRVTPLAFAAAAATLAAIATLLSRSPRAPSPAPPPAPTPPPTIAVARPSIQLAVTTSVPRASLSLRGHSYPLPIEIEIEPGREPEMVELSAAGHQTRRMWLVLDRTMRLHPELEATPSPTPPPAPPAALPIAPVSTARHAPVVRSAAPRPVPPARPAARPSPPAPDAGAQWVQAHRADVAPCASVARTAGLPPGTRLVVQVTLKPSGRVRSAAAQTLNEAEAPAARCLESAIRRWTFPPPRSPAAASLSLPFTL